MAARSVAAVLRSMIVSQVLLVLPLFAVAGALLTQGYPGYSARVAAFVGIPSGNLLGF
jgi:hypothetical protein